MDDDQPPAPGKSDAEPPQNYEAPTVEDLDTTFGPSVTAAGGVTVIAAPRDL